MNFVKNSILEKIIKNYLSSRDFNGISVMTFSEEAHLSHVMELISAGCVDLVRGDGHPNPHIKAFHADPIDVQLGKIKVDGLKGCLYPTPRILKERNSGDGEAGPFTRALKEGEPQLSYRAFDLRALQWYTPSHRKAEFGVDAQLRSDSAGLMIRRGFLSLSERRELEACVRSQREDHGIARRANAILLLDDGESCAQIAKFLYLDDDTIRGWYKTYQRAGWDALSVDAWQGGQSRMTRMQETALCDWLEERFCRSAGAISRAPNPG